MSEAKKLYHTTVPDDDLKTLLGVCEAADDWYNKGGDSEWLRETVRRYRAKFPKKEQGK